MKPVECVNGSIKIGKGVLSENKKSVFNHAGSVKLRESTCGIMGVKEFAAQGTPIKCIEGD